MIGIYEKISQLEKEDRSFVVVSVVNKSGHCPQIPGAKIIIDDSGDTFGTVGGGELEFLTIKESKEILSNNIKIKSFTKEYVLHSQDDSSVFKIDESCVASQTSMICGGKITVFYDIHFKKDLVYIFGAGHIGYIVSKYLIDLDFRVIMIDNRKLNEIASFPKHLIERYNDFFIHSNYDQNELNKIQFSRDAYFVIVTHSHDLDYDVLSYLYTNHCSFSPKYIGIIASKSKSNILMNKLTTEHGVDKDIIKSIYCPIGLKIGGSSPNEIALSIASEIQVLRYNNQKEYISHHTKKWLELYK